MFLWLFVCQIWKKFITGLLCKHIVLRSKNLPHLRPDNASIDWACVQSITIKLDTPLEQKPSFNNLISAVQKMQTLRTCSLYLAVGEPQDKGMIEALFQSIPISINAIEFDKNGACRGGKYFEYGFGQAWCTSRFGARLPRNVSFAWDSEQIESDEIEESRRRRKHYP
jgi:hypothetical protein